VVDPIDGTKAFIAGKPTFGTLIALLQHGRPILGIIDHPALSERWIGATGHPTMHNGRTVHSRRCAELGANVALSEVWGRGGEGGIELAGEVLRLVEQPNDFRMIYADEQPLRDKIGAVAREIYGADGVDYLPAAGKELDRLTALGFGNLPVCIAKTQYSLSDNPALIGRPTGFRITVKSVKLSAGAGFVVALTGDIMTMPGLPKVPAAERMNIDEKGVITGLF
jgi:formate--tetrahydrofolate ligase